MDELKNQIAKNYPIWVAVKESEARPTLQQRQVNGRLPNARQLTPQQLAEREVLQGGNNITNPYA